LPPFLQIFAHRETVLVEEVPEYDGIHSSLVRCDLDGFVIRDGSIDTEGTGESGRSGSGSDGGRGGRCRRREVDRGRLRSVTGRGGHWDSSVH
jgi:hypothetical protein